MIFTLFFSSFMSWIKTFINGVCQIFGKDRFKAPEGVVMKGKRSSLILTFTTTPSGVRYEHIGNGSGADALNRSALITNEITKKKSSVRSCKSCLKHLGGLCASLVRHSSFIATATAVIFINQIANQQINDVTNYQFQKGVESWPVF